MFNVFIKNQQISFATKVNTWIYYLRKLPLIKNIIQESLYKETEAKTILSYITFGFFLAFGLIKKLIYITLFIVVGSMLITDFTGADKTLVKFHLFFFLNFIIGSLMDNKFTDNFKEDFYMINIMKFDSKDYYLTKIITSYILNFIFFLFPIMLIGCNFFEAIILMLELTAFHSITQGFYLLFFKLTNIHLSKKWTFIIPGIVIPLAIAYGCGYLNIVFNFKAVYLNPLFIIITFILSAISFVYLFKYTKYTALSKSVLNKFTFDELNTAAENSMFMDVKINEKKISSEDLFNDKFKNRHGLQYLNAKFMERHKRIIVLPILRRSLIISICCIIIALIGLFVPNSRNTFNTIILSASGTAVFTLYCLSLGERFTRAFFFNCDVSLLRYRFYRESDVILSNFSSRLKISIFYNLIPALCLSIGLTLILILSKGDLLRFIPLFISILTLSVFFSVHYLFLYYIAQPYTSQLTIKSPIYRIVSFVIYMISFMCMQLNPSSLIFTLGVIAVTVLYIIVSLILVYKHAPKTFKLK